ncbi:MAG: glycosyltransferase family 4 protein [Nitrospirae bacterium]|nr:glycosyltransferase family 4 protein [Nitrospirota bacterium]MBF0540437.1 glycosyltransferase family 4 protein [Nitrospirota bacterium]
MKVLVANRYFYPYLGGVEFHIMNMAFKLIEQGCDVTVVCLPYKASSGSDEFNGIKIRRINHTHELFKVVREGFDICHVHMPRNMFSFTALVAAKLSGIATVFSPHCFYPGGSLLKRAGKEACDQTLTPMMFRLADRTIYSSKSDLDDALKRGLQKERAVKIPNSVFCKELSQVPIKDIRKKYGLNRPFILHVGRFDWVKNVDFIIKAHKGFIETHDLLMIGQDGGELNTARQLVNELGMNNYIKIIERAPFPDICSAYSLADVTVLASTYEGFPTVLLEALYFGSPVVSSDVGGVPHMLCDIDYGHCYEVKDMTQYIKTLKETISRGRTAAKAGHDFIKECYSWEVNGPAMYKLYSELINNGFKGTSPFAGA